MSVVVELYDRIQETDSTIFGMAKAQTSEQFALFVDQIGRAPVLRFSRWVDAHVRFDVGAGVEWSGPTREPSPPLLVQIQEFRQLQSVLHSISEPVEEERRVVGLLTGAWTRSKKFEMELDTGEVISGDFVDAITPEHAATLPRKYIAIIRTKKAIIPATEEEQVSHFLVKLERELPILKNERIRRSTPINADKSIALNPANNTENCSPRRCRSASKTTRSSTASSKPWRN